MSGESSNGSVEVGVALTPRTDSVSGASEFNLNYYGWRVVLAACLGVMAGFGSLFVYTFSVFVKPLAAEFGWSREAISSGFAIAAVTLGVISPLLGRWIDRLGPRRIILVCMTIYGCAIASLSLLRSGLWQFYVTCFVLGVVGNGAAHLAFSRSISTWFQRRLGTALAFVMVGAGLGAMILPVVAQSIISGSGWRAAYASLGGLALLLGLPLSWHYIRERGILENNSAPVAYSGMTWQQGLRSFSFWIIATILFVSSISMNGAITHLSALLTDRGLTAGNAALCASVLGGSSLLGRIVVGWLLDRFFGPRVALAIQPHYRAWHFSSRPRHQFSCRLLCCRAYWRGSRKRSRHYTVPADAILWPARFFHAVRSHLDVLCGCGSHRSGDTRTRIRCNRFLYIFADSARDGAGTGSSNESTASPLLSFFLCRD
ncbi:MAG: MFS transporter [Candidatus Sulfotelmatobacter sp.]